MPKKLYSVKSINSWTIRFSTVNNISWGEKMSSPILTISVLFIVCSYVSLLLFYFIMIFMF